MTASGDDLVRAVLAAVADGPLEGVRLLLHPYLHWTEHGVTVRGRRQVLNLLATRSVLEPPVRVELRDGQLYRWSADD